MFRAEVVVSAGLGAVGLPAVLAQENGLVGLGHVSPATLLVVLVAHEAGEVGRATLTRTESRERDDQP